MDLTYKLVSDWNQNTGVNINSLDSFISIDTDEVFSLNNSGSYSIIENNGIVHGVYSKSNIFNLHYFLYDGDEVLSETVLVNGVKIVAFNPQIVLKDDGYPLIVFYDIQSLSVKSVELTLSGWVSSIVDFSIMNTPICKREISVNKGDNCISSAYIVSEVGERKVRYAYRNGSEWVSETVLTQEVNGEIKSVSLIEDDEGVPCLFIGSSDGIYCYHKLSTGWNFINNTIVEDVVVEIDGAYDVIHDSVHLAYSDGYETKYQRFSFETDKFLDNYEFIDFNSSSVSVSVSSLGEPVISYSHVEKTIPLIVYLKIARGTANGEEFQSFNVDFSETGFKTGEFSDIALGSLDNIYIMYLKDGIVLYDESKFTSGLNSNTWLDKRAQNNLKSSIVPPSRNSDNTFMQFDSSLQQFFFINHCDQIELNKSEVEFSLSFIGKFKGGKLEQVIVSKNGFQIYLLNNFLRVRLTTIYGDYDYPAMTDSSGAPIEMPIDEQIKISVVYSGYDLKIYSKSNSDTDFSIVKWDVFGDVVDGFLPFTIGATVLPLDEDLSSSSLVSTSSSSESSSTSSLSSSSSSTNDNTSSSSDSSGSSSSTIEQSTSSGSSSSCTVEKNFEFINFLNADLTNVKYWKREINFEEATYDDSVVDYHMELDPYSDGLDYSTVQTGQGGNYFYLKDENLSVDDLGGVSFVDLLTYSKFTQEERVTIAPAISQNPFFYKIKNGGVNIAWADNRGSFSEIYINQFKSNNKINALINQSSTVKSSGSLGSVFADSNVFVDERATFLKDGVFEGDFLNLTDSDNYTGRKIPIIKVISDTMLELGVYFSRNNFDLGYYVDSKKIKDIDDFNIKLTNLKTTSSNPSAVSDSVGDSHIVWQSIKDGNYEIFYKRFRSTNAVEQMWGNVRLTNNDGNSENPSLAIDKNESLHVVWQDTRNNVSQIFYSFSSPVVCNTNLVPKFTRWNSDNFNSSDILISDKLIAIEPDIVTDADGVVHIVFSAFVSSSQEVSEIFYVNNKCGQFSKPIKITTFNSLSTSPKIEVDKYGNLIVVFVSNKENKDDIYVVKYNIEKKLWSSVRNVNNSLEQSKNPTISIDSSNVGYILWVDRDRNENVIKFAKYNIDLDSMSLQEQTLVSTQIDKSLSVNSVVDDTKTLFVTWEDEREFLDTDENNTEVYKNILTNLILTSETQDNVITDEEIEEIVNQVTSDIVSEDNIRLSNEILDDVIITYETDSVSYVRKVGDIGKPGNSPIILDSRAIRIKIKGLSNTLAYRIRNADDASSWSPFFRFTIDESPNTTIADWVLSRNNGPKDICIQLYTLQGLTSMICEDVFLNEPELFNVILLDDLNGNPGDVVSTEFNDSKVLTSKSYWAKIEPLKLVLPEEQDVIFDVSMQGLDILGVETELINGYYYGKFTIQPEDSVRYVDGDAKIIPQIIDK